ncbi:MAG: trypsin-like peptidase domain-containing protein [Ruminococcus sp.]|nr:trypsin-like peptidase domain-containing protein [Ruminococcus sp.]
MDEKDIYSDSGYVPLHEKAPESTDEVTPAESTPEPQPGDEPVKPVYDAFMYEPIGFDEPAAAEEEETSGRKKRKKNSSSAALLFTLLMLVSIAIALFGIVKDIVNSKEAINKISAQRNVVLYRKSKPAGANDPDNFVDSSGKYTVEGAAAAVIDSIVEIYTYSDAGHNTFVGSGSGIVITEDGYIVTNAHVLQSDGYHTVKTNDGSVYDAKIVGRDIKTDIAVIKVSDVKMKPATLGDSDETIVGEQVIAVGNPAGLSSSVTDGIVSHVGRKVRGDSNKGFQMECIQTNAQISPGNSGGALVNMYGQVIGITSSKLVSSTLEGLGFAITINQALPIIEELINKGYVTGRFRIGISLMDMNTDSRRLAVENKLGFKIPDGFKGVYIGEIFEDSDIKNTDLKVGDFITEINGKAVSSYNELYDAISSQYSAGDTVPATCAHLEKDSEPVYYHIRFKLIEDRSGNF